ncbi:MAG: hypothetical protein ACR2IS_18595 [Nitrososphaeraceae archaeon]
MLVDVGQGVNRSLEKIDFSCFPNLNKLISKSCIDTAINKPDAIVVTHSLDDHVKELPVEKDILYSFIG